MSDLTKKLKNKFILVAMLSVAALLVSILTVVNVVNFALVEGDADRSVEIVSGQTNFAGQEGLPFDGQPQSGQPFDGQQSGQSFGDQPQSGEPNGAPPNGNFGGGMFDRGAMGPGTPDNNASMRFFTVVFDENGQAVETRLNMSAVDETQATEWAQTLLSGNVGWTRLTYRFKTTSLDGGGKSVTVVDQSRELLPSFRVLTASVIGTIAGLLITYLILVALAGKFVKPIEDNDLKQKQFIVDAARELKTPLTVISIERDRLKQTFGENEQTAAVDKQVDALVDLTKQLDRIARVEMGLTKRETVNLTDILNKRLTAFENSFSHSGITLKKSVQENLTVSGDGSLLYAVVDEILKNGLAFAKTEFYISLVKEGGRISIVTKNDCKEQLKDGQLDMVFDRFYKSDLSLGKGLGFAVVKEAVDLLGGRVGASARQGEFTLKIEL